MGDICDAQKKKIINCAKKKDQMLSQINWAVNYLLRALTYSPDTNVTSSKCTFYDYLYDLIEERLEVNQLCTTISSQSQLPW